ncbi:hypothetical protein N5D48_25410 [Pseudomonas sp. GD03858]|uniref:RHS repeat-associated core domain-containing protein n=1 Tax=unclassified Pseudomonas TaxID=196821 RepID=UPI00244AB41B|nr:MULTISPECIES: RHS repeat-associated core domain-containing protein [unclassified Pseudomonas]MDH0650104.1 hypothetical protein [Pseudomonas sp. GD03867]MDH0665748.1 hypothetical protein [Pseudomonas sp. GD03858]
MATATLLAVQSNQTPIFALTRAGVAVFAFTPYGFRSQLTGAGRIATGFTGWLCEHESDTYAFGHGHRFFSAELHGFRSYDQERSPFGGEDINGYVYCKADPINRTDHSGRQSKLLRRRSFSTTPMVEPVEYTPGHAGAYAAGAVSIMAGLGNLAMGQLGDRDSQLQRQLTGGSELALGIGTALAGYFQGKGISHSGDTVLGLTIASGLVVGGNIAVEFGQYAYKNGLKQTAKDLIGLPRRTVSQVSRGVSSISRSVQAAGQAVRDLSESLSSVRSSMSSAYHTAPTTPTPRTPLERERFLDDI